MPRAVRDLAARPRSGRPGHRSAAPEPAGWPYASLVLVAVDHDLSPILLLSDLAEHTKAIAADGRVSLLFDGTGGLDQPLTGAAGDRARRAERTDDERLKRALPRAPSRCRDVCRLQGLSASTGSPPERAHLVARLRQDPLDRGGRTAGRAPRRRPGRSEAGIVSHMNEDHADAVQLYAAKLLGLPGGGWTMTGIDAGGHRPAAGGTGRPAGVRRAAASAGEARKVLVALVGQGPRGLTAAATVDSATRHGLRGCEGRST